MSAVFGIDLGTTNSVIARLDGGRPVPIPVAGDAVVPSVVLYLPDRVVVGREARNLELQHPERTLRSIKRKIGTDHRYEIAGRLISPEEASAEILSALRRGAEAATGEVVRDVVITVPAYFDDAQRRATLRAGELSGMNVLRLLNEPTAASLVYEQITDKGGEPEIILIYDLGGGTFDVSVLEVFEGVREVLSTTGNTHLGGDDFDELLMRRFLDELRRRHGIDPREDPRAMARLRDLSETTKIALSTQAEVNVREEFLATRGGEAVHLDMPVARRQFEDLVYPLLSSTIDLSRKAVEEARLAGRPIRRVCLVGGSTRIPLVRRLLEEAFSAEVHEEIDPDLAVGLGAAVQSGLLQGAQVERILVDVNAHTLGIRVVGHAEDFEADTFAPVLRKNTALPAERTEEFYTMHDDQARLTLEAFQGESPRVSGNSRIGAFDVPLLPRPMNSPIRVRFAYDLNGVVRISVSQPGAPGEKTMAFKVEGTPLALPEAQAPAPAPESAIERKAAALLSRLSDERRRAGLSALLASYRIAPVGSAAREAAEEALLDLFIDADDADGA